MLRRRRLLTAAAAALPLALTHSIPAATRAKARTLALQEHARAGDLVFRVGTSPESLAVRSVSHRALSHVGVAVNAGGAVAVVHATPADSRSAGGVIVSSWADYGVGEDVESVHLYRIKDLTSSERAHVVSAALSLLGAPFDAQFRLAPADGSVYCTMLALRAYGRADPSIFAHVRPRSVAMLDEPVYLPEALLAWPRFVAAPASAV